VATHGINGANPFDEGFVNELWASTVFSFGRQHETRIIFETRVFVVIVMIHPSAEPVAESTNEGQRDFFETTGLRARESDVQDHHAPFELARFWQFAWRPDGEARFVHVDVAQGRGTIH
jgi:hypothetical protein